MDSKSRKYLKVKVVLTLASISTSLTAITMNTADAAGKSIINKTGRITASVSNTILNGKGVPSASLGIDGDFYIDRVALNMYGPKLNGHWPIPVSLRGPVGPAGPTGLNGVDGKDGAKGVATSGAGIAGPKGDTGPAGPTGPSGSSGATGPAGPTGPAGSGGGGTPGPTGATGATGAAGPKGDTGTAGTNGTNGSNGSAGATGAVGATGPSEVKVVNIGVSYPNTWTMSSSSYAESVSDAFGNLQANKSYDFTLILTGSVTRTGFNGCSMGSNVVATAITSGTNIPISLDTSYSFGKFAATSSDKSFRFNFVHHGTINAGSTGANLTASIIDGDGCTGTSFLPAVMSITGKAYFQLVGSVA
jgi:hypothetical protein